MSEEDHYPAEATQVFETVITPKIQFSKADNNLPQNYEHHLLSGHYKSNGGALSQWSFGFNNTNDYWNYDFSFGSNLTVRFMMGDLAERDGPALTLSRSGADFINAFITGDYDLEGVEEEKVEEVIAQAREIDIGHRLRELKNILVNLKAALKTKSVDTDQALLDVLENVEDI